MINHNMSKSLYNILYSLNESYYNQLLKYQKDSLLESSNQSVFKKALDWLSVESKKAEEYVVKNNVLLSKQLETIALYIHPKYEHNAESFGYKEYSIPIDIRSKFLPLPNDIYKSLDVVDKVESALYDDDSYKRMCTKIYFVSLLPMWFTKNTTLDSMSKYLDKESEPLIREGSYQVKKLIVLIAQYIQDSREFSHNTEEAIKREKRQLDLLLDKVKSKRQSLYKNANTNLKSKINVLFDLYESIIDLVYMQLSIYQRSVMNLYGKYITEIGNVVHDMFDDIDPQVKISLFGNEDFIKQYNQEKASERYVSRNITRGYT